MNAMLMDTCRVLRTSAASVLLFAMLYLVAGCEAEEPTREDSPEMVTTVTATFTPEDGGEAIVGQAIDPDAEGIRDIETDGPIVLRSGTNYLLTLGMYNDLAEKDSDEYDISAEVEAEGDEHMIFFGWSGDLFADPTGNGNIDSRNDPMQYDDTDESGLPLGIHTKWTTAASASGTFRILLKHQPELKSETSTSEMGESDLDVIFDVEIK